jgi:hypothetical protein
VLGCVGPPGTFLASFPSKEEILEA